MKKEEEKEELKEVGDIYEDGCGLPEEDDTSYSEEQKKQIADWMS